MADTGRPDSALTPADLRKLADGFITPELAAAAGLYRVDDEAGAESVGQKRGGGREFAGIIFPYTNPKTGIVCKRRLRRDQGELIRQADGSTKEEGKYLGFAGEPNRIYYAPAILPAELTNTSIPVLVHEGEKKALASARCVQVSGEKVLPIAFPGVYGWRGRIAIEANSKGRRTPVRGAIRDLDEIDWKRRKVYVLFDTNVHTNEKVRAARQGLADELKSRGAQVYFAEMPVECGVNGIDDLLGQIASVDGVEIAVETWKALLRKARPAAKQSQKDHLLGLASEMELFHNPDGDAFARIMVEDHVENHRISTKAFREYLAHQHYKQEGSAPGSQAVQDAVSALAGQARHEGHECRVDVRIAHHDGNIYVDLCNSRWEILEIAPSGHRVIHSADAPVRFRRTKGMLPLPTPAESGNVAALRPFLNLCDVGDENDGGDVLFLLILSWLVATFRPDYPFPVLIFTGPPGTAKSTTAALIRQLVDPNVAVHRSAPRNEEDLMISAVNSWVSSFDNLSDISPYISDALCKLATGGSLGKRKLYEDDEEVILTAERPIILNGIGAFASRTDLLDRSILVNLKPIEKTHRITERQFWKDFENKRQEIFTGLVIAVSSALKNVEKVALTEAPRMADFAEWATAAEESLGFGAGSFARAFYANRDESHALVLESSTTAEILMECCDAGKISPGVHLLKEFLADLRRYADADAGNLRTSRKDFPKSSKGLRGELQRLDPNLRELGIKIDFLGKSGPDARKGASINLEYKRSQTSQTSQSSQMPSNVVNMPTASGDVYGDVPFDVDEMIDREERAAIQGH
nr:putative ATP-binding protein [uncultured bacterium]